MLEQLRISDYQCHEKLDIEFDEKITAIVGPSDVGKSAALRALKWLCHNRPVGNAFIRNGSKWCKAGLKVDGSRVIRSKGETTNTYRLNGELYEAFGTGIPEDITKLLNLDETNFAGQHEPSFWFSLSPGEVAKRLNSIVDLSLVDEVMTSLLSRLRKSRTEAEVVEERLKDAEVKLKELEHIPQMDDELVGVERLQTKATESEALASRLRDFVDEGRNYKEKASKARRMEEEGREVVRLGDKSVRVRYKESCLAVFVVEYVEHDEEILKARDIEDFGGVVVDAGDEFLLKSEKAERLLDLIEQAMDTEVLVNVYVPDKSNLEELLREHKEASRVAILLTDWIDDAISHCQLRDSFERKQKRFKEELEKETEGLCPVCGKPWEGDK